MASYMWVRRKRQQIEEYLEAQLILGELTKEEAQKKYKDAVEELGKVSDEDVRDKFTLDSL